MQREFPFSVSWLCCVWHLACAARPAVKLGVFALLTRADCTSSVPAVLMTFIVAARLILGIGIALGGGLLLYRNRAQAVEQEYAFNRHALLCIWVKKAIVHMTNRQPSTLQPICGRQAPAEQCGGQVSPVSCACGLPQESTAPACPEQGQPCPTRSVLMLRTLVPG